MFGKGTWIGAVALVALSACSGGANQTTPAADLGLASQARDTKAQGLPAAIPSGPGYTVTVFARGTSTLKNPDPIVSVGGWTYVAYQNATASTGGGGDSTIVQYAAGGVVHHTLNLPGRIDGMRFNPYDGKMWVTVNEDANSSLFTVDVTSWAVKHYTFSSASHGGGYDDLAFANGKAFIAASNPTLNSSGINTHPALVSVVLNGGVAEVTPVLMGNASASDIRTGGKVTLNLTDPDSMTVAPSGTDVVLISQADQEFVRIYNAGLSTQTVSRLLSTAQLDDTQFALESDGLFYVVDQNANVIYIIRGAIRPGAIYTQANNFVATMDPNTGALTNAVTGFQKPSGLLFVSDRDADALRTR